MDKDAPLSPEEQKKNADLFEKFFRLMDSSESGEAEAAFRRARATAPKLGLSFGELLDMAAGGLAGGDAEQLKQQLEEYIAANEEFQKAQDILLKENESLRLENEGLRENISSHLSSGGVSSWRAPGKLKVLARQLRYNKRMGIPVIAAVFVLAAMAAPYIFGHSAPQQPKSPPQKPASPQLTSQQVTDIFNNAAQKTFAKAGYSALESKRPGLTITYPAASAELIYQGQDKAGNTVILTADCLPHKQAKTNGLTASCKLTAAENAPLTFLEINTLFQSSARAALEKAGYKEIQPRSVSLPMPPQASDLVFSAQDERGNQGLMTVSCKPSGEARQGLFTIKCAVSDVKMSALTGEEIALAFKDAAQSSLVKAGYSDLSIISFPAIAGEPQAADVSFSGKDSAQQTVRLTEFCIPKGDARQGEFSVKCTLKKAQSLG